MWVEEVSCVLGCEMSRSGMWVTTKKAGSMGTVFWGRDSISNLTCWAVKLGVIWGSQT